MTQKVIFQKPLMIAAVAAAVLMANGTGFGQQGAAPTDPPAQTQTMTPAQSTTAPEAPRPQTPAASQTSTSTSQQQTTSAQSTSAQSTLSQHDQAAQDVKKQEKQRILGVMPEFNTTDNPNAVPLSVGQKFDLAFHSAIDPWQFFLAGVDAGIGQAQNSFPAYGQGMEGYGKRFGAAYLDAFDGTMIGNALFPAMFHQDPRYFRKGTGKKMYRFLYAAASTVRCKGDNGKWQWNYSNVAGNVVAGAISNVYYPPSDRGLGLTFQRAATVTAEGAIGAELLEFWPDIQKKIHRHKKNAADADAARATSAPAAH
jgi:hypothetical protein